MGWNSINFLFLSILVSFPSGFFRATLVDAHAHNSIIQREHLKLRGHPSHELYGKMKVMKVMVGNRKVEMSHEQFKLLMMTLTNEFLQKVDNVTAEHIKKQLKNAEDLATWWRYLLRSIG